METWFFVKILPITSLLEVMVSTSSVTSFHKHQAYDPLWTGSQPEISPDGRVAIKLPGDVENHYSFNWPILSEKRGPCEDRSLRSVLTRILNSAEGTKQFFPIFLGSQSNSVSFLMCSALLSMTDLPHFVQWEMRLHLPLQSGQVWDTWVFLAMSEKEIWLLSGASGTQSLWGKADETATFRDCEQVPLC